MQTKHKQATTHLANLEKKEDPFKQAPAVERKVAKALAMHHGALTAQIEAVTTQWVLLQQQVVADMSWRELDMQVSFAVGFRANGDYYLLWSWCLFRLACQGMWTAGLFLMGIQARR